MADETLTLGVAEAARIELEELQRHHPHGIAVHWCGQYPP